jgi:hypothetical protein
MRNGMLLLAIVAVSVMLASGIALAESLTGTNGDDRLMGTDGRDHISGGGGHDLIIGRGGRDALYGDSGRDVLRGGRADDDMQGGLRADRLFAGGGNDDFVNVIDGHPDDFVDCGPGYDIAFIDSFYGRGEDRTERCEELRTNANPNRFNTARSSSLTEEEAERALEDGHLKKVELKR